MNFLDYFKRLFHNTHKDPINFIPIKSSGSNMETKKKLCAIVIGHKKSSPGASNPVNGVTEFEFNDKLARNIENYFINNDLIEIQKVYRRTYNSLPSDINELNPDFIISLHCNAFNQQASGTEVLYYHKSEKSKKLADILNKNLNNALKLPDRGIRGKTSEDRGGYLLKNTFAPCVIAEPFFIDNIDELNKVNSKMSELINAYVETITEYAKEI